MIETISNWVSENKTWLFDGLGAALLIFVLGLVLQRSRGGNNQVQKGGRNSQNYQAGGDIHIGKKTDD